LYEEVSIWLMPCWLYIADYRSGVGFSIHPKKHFYCCNTFAGKNSASRGVAAYSTVPDGISNNPYRCWVFHCSFSLQPEESKLTYSSSMVSVKVELWLLPMLFGSYPFKEFFLSLNRKKESYRWDSMYSADLIRMSATSTVMWIPDRF